MKKQFCYLAAAMILVSCGTPKQINYFQDVKDGQIVNVQSPLEIKVRPEDKLSIVVSTRDPQLGQMFNLGITGSYVGSSKSYGSQMMCGYTVDANGDIDFPVLGKINVAGKNRFEIAELIKDKLISSDLLKDAVVTVEFDKMYYSVMGEVAHPGRFAIEKDRVTVLEALSTAGDLTIYGVRKNVVVMRNEGDKNRVYRLNLCNADSLAMSPAYYLQQNDVVYVEPNTMRARQSTVNGNNVLSTSFWISVASLLTSIAVLLKK